MKLTIHPYRFPFRSPLYITGHTFTDRTGLILQLNYSQKTVWSEVAPLPGFSEETTGEAEQWLRDNRYQIEQCLTYRNPVTGLDGFSSAPPSVRFGISALSHLTEAQNSHQSLSRYLNPDADSSVSVNATLGMQSPEEAVKSIADFYEQGFRTLKIKVGRNFQADSDLLHRIRGDFPQLTLRLDANRAWSFEESVDNLKRLARFSPEYCEEPLRSPTTESLAQLKSRSPVPIAADESIRSLSDAQSLFENNAVDILILKPMLLGEIECIKEIVQLAGTHQVDCIFTSSLESGVGRLITAHLAAAFLDHHRACGLATGSMLSRDTISDEQFIQSGNFLLPDGPIQPEYPKQGES